MATVTFPEDGGFSYDLTTNIGKVRYRIGDTRQGSAVLADEEITEALTNNADDLDHSAIECLDLMEARLLASDSSSAGQQVQRSQRLEAIRSMRDRLRHKLSALTGPKLTGLSTDDAYTTETSAVQPIFKRGQFDR